jgi:general secretion pathway protein J
LREATSDRVLSVSTVTPVHVDAAAGKVGNASSNDAKEPRQDDNKNSGKEESQAPNAPRQGGS